MDEDGLHQALADVEPLLEREGAVLGVHEEDRAAQGPEDLVDVGHLPRAGPHLVDRALDRALDRVIDRAIDAPTDLARPQIGFGTV